MILGIDPKNDYAFKFVFGSEQRTAILVDLLNAVLEPPPGHRVVSVEIRNPITEQVVLDDKLSILDIKAKDQRGRQFNVEMQMLVRPSFPNRILYYWSKIYSGQLTIGDEYELLRPVISICFLDGILYPQVEQCHLHFQLREAQAPIIFSDQMDIHVFQLPLFTKKAEELTSPLEKWLYFLNNGEYLDTDQMPQTIQEPAICNAARALNMLTQDEIERERYEAREKAKRDALSWAKWMERTQQEAERVQQEMERVQQEAERIQQEMERVQQEAERIQQEKQRAQQDAERAQQDAERAQQDAERAQQDVERAQQDVERAQQEKEHLRQEVESSRAEGFIEQIQIFEQLLKMPVTPVEELQAKPLSELQQMTHTLRHQLLG